MGCNWRAAAIAAIALPFTAAAQQSAPAKVDSARAQQIVTQVCAACHGADGNSPTAANPNLAGQHADYITLQLTHYKTGVRVNPIMQSMAAPLSDADMRALGVYFSQQKPKGLTARDPALVKIAQKIYRGGDLGTGLPACAACHTPTGAGIPKNYPRVAGQYADYTYAQLRAFKLGERGHDKGGKDVNGRIMVTIATKLSDEQMKAIADYMAGLRKLSAATIAALYIYPVKACRGIAVDTAGVEITGLACGGVRDREWMIVDSRRRFVTQREHPRLALVSTSIVEDTLRLSAPGADAIELTASQGERCDVTVWRSTVRAFDAGDAAAEWISRFAGEKLRVVRFDRTRPRLCNPDYAADSGAHTFFADGYPLLVIGQSSLDDLNERLIAKGHAALPMNRFRPNVVVAGIDAYDEDHLDTLTINGVTLRLVKPCVRCKVTTTDQATAKVGIEPLSTLSTYRRSDALAGVTFGVNAIVVEGADRAVSVGDAVTASYRF